MKTHIYLLFLLFFIFLLSCTQKEVEKPIIYGEEVVLKRYEDSTKMMVIQYNVEDTAFAFKTYFYRNGGKYMAGGLHNGLRNGQWSAWDESGKILTIGNYVDGMSQGLKIVYFTNGNKRYEGQLEQNERIGIWKFWNEQDSLVKEIDYGQPKPQP